MLSFQVKDMTMKKTMSVMAAMVIWVFFCGCEDGGGVPDKPAAGTMQTGRGDYRGVYDEVPLNAVEPTGWIRAYLSDQADGLTGHVEAAGYPFDTDMWAADKIRDGEREADWAAYEQTAFYLDGALRVGLLLNDEALLARVRRQVEHVLAHPDSKGVLGPEHIANRWQHANFFRMMLAYYHATGDSRIVEALVRHYKADTVGHSDAGFGRSSVNVEILCRLYQITGDRALLERAVEIREAFDAAEPEMACATPSLLSDTLPHIHGAMFAEMVHLPAVLSMYTGLERMLRASVNGYDKLIRQEMFVNGGFCSQEGTGGQDVRNVHETCALADFIYNTGYLLMATGEVRWADMIERAALNAGVSVVTNHFRAFQYFSCPNLLLATRWSSYVDAPDEKDDTKTHFTRARFMYRPGHSVQCCTGSVHRLMPGYVSRMWLSDGQGGLAAALYGPSAIRARVGAEQVPVTVRQKTAFPFSDLIAFHFEAPNAVTFSFRMRIPGWADAPTVQVNGEPVEAAVRPGTFFELRRRFQEGDIVTLTLPSELKMTAAQGGYAVEKGPLVYTLAVEEERTAVPFRPWGQANERRVPNEAYPQWNMEAGSEWRYGFACRPEDVGAAGEFESRAPGEYPWESGHAPVKLTLPVRRIQNWDYEFKRAEEMRIWPGMEKTEVRPEVFRFTPPLPEVPACGPDVIKAEFVPYGSTCLRMTVLPLCVR